MTTHRPLAFPEAQPCSPCSPYRGLAMRPGGAFPGLPVLRMECLSQGTLSSGFGSRLCVLRGDVCLGQVQEELESAVSAVHSTGALPGF